MKNRTQLGRMVLAAVLIALVGGCQQWQRTSQPAKRPTDHDQLREARLFQQRGQLDQALIAFEEVLRDNPQLTQAHMGMGDIYRVKGNYDKAAEKYKTARDLKPQNYGANYKLGLMYHLLNRLGEAIQTYLAALAIQPNSFEANLNLATAYLQTEQPQLGLPYAETAAKLKPTSQPAHVNLGSIYASMGQHHLAIESYRTAAEMGNLEPEIMLNMSDSLIRVGRYRRAANTLDLLSKAKPSGMVYERLGYVHFKLGDFPASLAHYREALSYDPKDTQSLNGVGVILMTQYLHGRRADRSLRDEAIASWRRSVQLNSNQQRIIDLIARYGKL